MDSVARHPPGARDWLGANGALCVATAIALSAYAAHAVQGHDQARMQLAAIMAFGHGIALAALAPTTARRLGRTALLLAYAGMLLFCGSLVFAVLAGWPTALAPFGGITMIGGWLLFAGDRLRG
jgi:uncharacterized membrane protein YgdD (TMEM256/DUF423 family)